MESPGTALAKMWPWFRRGGPERVALPRADGRVLFADWTARCDSPPFANSAMDGYALAASGTRSATGGNPVSLRVVGESRAGGPPPPPVGAGEAVRIFTGAPIPAGADAVEMQENTARAEDRVSLVRPVPVGHHVRAQGEDLTAGAVAIAAGTRLGPAEVGLLASQDVASVTVTRRPRVAIVCTGDELRDIGEVARPGSIVNSNAYALAAQVTRAGGEPWVLPQVADVLADIEATLTRALTADVVLTCGGVSAGDYDLVHESLARLGVCREFWKVSVKPGKPLWFGHHGAIPVVGLPGNPVSAMVVFEAFVRPCLRRMLGDARPFRTQLGLPLLGALAHAPGRTELVRASVTRTPDGLAVRPLASQGSGSLVSMVGADALVIVPEQSGDLAYGARVDALWVTDDGGSLHPPFGAAVSADAE